MIRATTLAIGSIAAILTFPGSSVLTTLARPFVPPEILTLKDQSNCGASYIPVGDEAKCTESKPGFVVNLDESGQWMTVMWAESRAVEIVAASDVVDRSVCELSADHGADPIVDWFQNSERSDAFRARDIVASDPYQSCGLGDGSVRLPGAGGAFLDPERNTGFPVIPLTPPPSSQPESATTAVINGG